MLPGVGGGGGAGSGISRPFIFAVVLMLLFLTARTDLDNPDRKLEAAAERGGAARSAQAKERETVNEKIMLDVSVENERLQEVNRRLRLEVFALRRAVRGAGGELPPAGETLIGVSASALGLDTDEDFAGGGSADAAPAGGAAAQQAAAEGGAAAEAGAGGEATRAPTPRRALHEDARLRGGQGRLGDGARGVAAD